MNESQPRSIAKRVTVAATSSALVVAFLGLAGRSTEIWDGGYPYVACEITFRDPEGNPIEGVTLSVERPLGIVRHHMPIDDFYPRRTPTSDENGTLRFHCRAHSFGGTRHRYFFVIETGDVGPPENICRFEYRKKTVHTIPFNDLAFEYWGTTPTTVTRSIAVPDDSQVFVESIPPVRDLQSVEHEFHLVQRTVQVQP